MALKEGYYSSELAALKKAGRFRERRLFDSTLVDMASNDYLGLAANKSLFEQTYRRLQKEQIHAPKASMLVNGYSSIHAEFEHELSSSEGFEDAIVVGSGFLANIALIEALVRKGDRLFIDSEYHASGIFATKAIASQVSLFEHNNPEALEAILKESAAKRNIIAIEGVYSMSGDVAKAEFFEIAARYGAILIVDEAHSAGVIGEKLHGIFDHYNITPEPNHIKMGTLGKAFGSYGAYILASKEIISYLENRAKPLIYSTAPSLFDIALAHTNYCYVKANATKMHKELLALRALASSELKKEINSAVVPVVCRSNSHTLALQKALALQGFLVGAIRQPTVATPQLRITLMLGNSPKQYSQLFGSILEHIDV